MSSIGMTDELRAARTLPLPVGCEPRSPRTATLPVGCESRAARTLPLPDVKIFKETKKDQK